MLKKIVAIVALALAPLAFAGTTTIDFTQDVGNLIPFGGSPAITKSLACRAAMGGAGAWVVSNSGTPVHPTGAVSVSFILHPSVDAANGSIALTLFKQSNPNVWLRVTIDNSSYNATLDSSENILTSFSKPTFPNAPNNQITLTYDFTADVATMSVAGVGSPVSLNSALTTFGETTGDLVIGVISQGAAGFEDFNCTGGSIPDLISTGACTGDADNDGLIDVEELGLGSCFNPLASDSDNDGISDYDEVTNYGTNTVAAYNPGNTNTSACDSDTDNDGLSDAEETTSCPNPLIPDSDNDGISDYNEMTNFGANLVVAYNPGITNTDVCNPDTDNDGVSDLTERNFGHDPLDPLDFPALPVADVWGLLVLGMSLCAGGVIYARKRAGFARKS